jgi:hypothetical protein
MHVHCVVQATKPPSQHGTEVKALCRFPQAPPFLVNPLSTICDPYLNVFRGLIPPIGGTFDLSPILAFVVLDIFTGSAASLGAELPAQPDASKTQENQKRQD